MSSTAKSHLKPARSGAKGKDKICPNMPELMKAVANFDHEDFYRPTNLAQFGTTTLYYRYFNLNCHQTNNNKAKLTYMTHI